MTIDSTHDATSSSTRRQRIGILGGTFDPIHVGHLIIAAEATHALDLDQMLFVPAGQPPHKPGQVISSDEDRCSMIEIAIDLRPAFQLSEIDLQQSGPSYSVELLERLQALHPESDLYFLIGADSLRDLHTWHDPHRIPQMATLVVAGRPGVEARTDDILASIPELSGRLEFIEAPLIDVSSTDIRERMRTGRPIWYQVPLGVEQYITDHRLYR